MVCAYVCVCESELQSVRAKVCVYVCESELQSVRAMVWVCKCARVSCRV